MTLKATGIVRKVDELGRIVIPKELRTFMGLGEGSPAEIYVGDNGEIILKLYEPGCQCGEMDSKNLIKKGKLIICKKCIAELNEMAKQAQ